MRIHRDVKIQLNTRLDYFLPSKISTHEYHRFVFAIVVPSLVEEIFIELPIILLRLPKKRHFSNRENFPPRERIGFMRITSFHVRSGTISFGRDDKYGPYLGADVPVFTSETLVLASVFLERRQPDRIAARVSNRIKKSRLPGFNATIVFTSHCPKQLHYSPR